MRKLKLESLTVESFETTATGSLMVGTVRGNAQVAAEDTGVSLCVICQISVDVNCQTEDPELCGDTNYLDCTFVCSAYASCEAC
jgi:hypothetical protein